MTNSFTDDDFIFNGMFLSLENITLNPEQMAWAIELSQSIVSELQRWQTYLNALALAGIEQWLQKRAPELALSNEWLPGKEIDVFTDSSHQKMRMKKQTHPTLNESICQIKINDFNLYLITMSSLYDTKASLSKKAVESFEFIPHFYVLVEVIEELGQANILGYLQRERFIHQQQSIGLQRESDTTYLVPVDWFEQDSDKLLLCLRCLEPTAISVAAHQESTFRSSLLPSLVQESTQHAINVGLWLRDELDRVAQEFSWILLPPTSFRSEFRALGAPIEQFNNAIVQLMSQGGIVIPPQAREAYRNLQWENIALRLYVVAWELPATGLVREWTLLLILGAQPNATLPIGIKLQVGDEVQILAEPVLRDRSQDYLYVQVIGTQSERFWVTISLPDGAALTLPAFTFEGN
jgi:hypothetical protein